MKPSNLIHTFKLQPHPEGGYYARSYESEHSVHSTQPERYQNEPRPAGTAIYYLLAENDFSAWHRLKSDELWHFYQGCAVTIYTLNEQGILTMQLLGNPTIHPGASFQVVIPAGTWFAAKPTDECSYCFVGCTVSPGFDFKDFELGSLAILVKKFPQHEDVIRQFTKS